MARTDNDKAESQHCRECVREAGQRSSSSRLPFAGAAAAADAFSLMLKTVKRRNLPGVVFSIDITGLGAAGSDAHRERRVFLDDLSEFLVSAFRCSDLVVRSGERHFLVVAAPATAETVSLLNRRLRVGIEAVLRAWRQRGIVTCCAVSQDWIDEEFLNRVDRAEPRLRLTHSAPYVTVRRQADRPTAHVPELLSAPPRRPLLQALREEPSRNELPI